MHLARFVYRVIVVANWEACKLGSLTAKVRGSRRSAVEARFLQFIPDEPFGNWNSKIRSRIISLLNHLSLEINNV